MFLCIEFNLTFIMEIHFQEPTSAPHMPIFTSFLARDKQIQ